MLSVYLKGGGSMEIINCIVNLLEIILEHSDELIIGILGAFFYDIMKNRSYGDKSDKS